MEFFSRSDSYNIYDFCDIQCQNTIKYSIFQENKFKNILWNIFCAAIMEPILTLNISSDNLSHARRQMNKLLFDEDIPNKNSIYLKLSNRIFQIPIFVKVHKPYVYIRHIHLHISSNISTNNFHETEYHPD